MTEPIFFKGQRFSDQRGEVNFNNSVDLSSFKRFYTIENCLGQEFRGWHGHQWETKLFVAIQGEVTIGAVRVDNWSCPSPSSQKTFFNLKAGTMDAVFVPGGYANGILSRRPNSIVLVMSSSTLEESKQDDFRYAPETWDIA